ncbi:MAG TPA: tetratricopeptide repeat protein [Solimonas sp.]
MIAHRISPSTRRLLWLLPLLLASACTTSRGTKEVWPYPEPPVSGQPQTPSGRPTPGAPIPDDRPASGTPIPSEDGPAMRPVPEYPRNAEAVSGAAVASLIRQARTQREAGRPDQAAASLERALRIEPRNYFTWSALGQTYLAQKNYAQAESVAQKSNVLARGNVWVELENWRTIAAAREARGEALGALEAQTRADELAQWLRSAGASN